MANITPSWVQVHPSYVMPEFLIQQQQASGAFNLLAGEEPMVRLGDGDLYAYVKRLDIRTKASAGQSAYNMLPSVTTVASMISTPSYLIRVRAEYDHHDVAAGGNWGMSVVEAQRLGMRQAHFQQARNALLYGFSPSTGEGLLNAAGATSIPLPPDSNSHDTVVTYDNGQMAFFLLSQIAAIKTRTNQLGIPHRITICGPQRVLSGWEYQGIVQVTQFQREGAGSLPVAGVVKEVGMMNGDTVDWAYDDTLIGKGIGGNDAVIITIAEIETPKGGKINTNAFAQLTPNLAANNIQLCDMAAPREIPTPIPGGAIDVVSEWRITSGWGLRGEAITVVSMQYQ